MALLPEDDRGDIRQATSLQQYLGGFSQEGALAVTAHTYTKFGLQNSKKVGGNGQRLMAEQFAYRDTSA